jgi:hypothetical protein
VTIVNYASSSINKLKASLNDDASIIIYDCHMFTVQATGRSRLSGEAYTRAMIVTKMAMMVMLGVMDVEMDWRKAAF